VARLGEPVAIVRKLFYGFKLLQLSVFGGWCYLYGDGSLAIADRGVGPLGVGSVLLVAGQVLNWTVFYRLGAAGVFYGDRLGLEVPRCRAFPFSVLAHPQYVGTVLSIWGLFVAMRFPHGDWSLLPALETVYYVVGARLEGRRPDVAHDPGLAPAPVARRDQPDPSPRGRLPTWAPCGRAPARPRSGGAGFRGR
jgi:methylene-fatty-acyl-phospholipid synthase